jgi:hypothetical protein
MDQRIFAVGQFRRTRALPMAPESSNIPMPLPLIHQLIQQVVMTNSTNATIGPNGDFAL